MKIEDHYMITSRIYIHIADNDTILRVKQDIEDRVSRKFYSANGISSKLELGLIRYVHLYETPFTYLKS